MLTSILQILPVKEHSSRLMFPDSAGFYHSIRKGLLQSEQAVRRAFSGDGYMCYYFNRMCFLGQVGSSAIFSMVSCTGIG